MAELRQRVIPAEVSLPQAADCGASSQPTGNLEPPRSLFGQSSTRSLQALGVQR